MIPIDLAGKRALITGAAGGIGGAAAVLFARAGASLVLIDRNGSGLDRLLEELAPTKAQMHSYALDVSDGESVSEAVEAAIREAGGVDILVNNAGISHPVPFEQLNEEAWRRVIGVNLQGAFNCCRALFPHMKAQGGGRIINISSINAWTGGGILSTSGYAAAKAGLLGLTRGLAREGAPHGILVNAIAPGLIDTPMTQVEAFRDRITSAIDSIPLKRAGRPDEVAGAILFLASDLSSYVTGTVVHVNGGLFMG